MLDREIEYKKMASVEENLWWYKSLHLLIFKSIGLQATTQRIVDAGCGTGGLMRYLNNKGYKNIIGFDLSKHAVAISQSRDLEVFNGDLKAIRTYFDLASKDVIISNDNLYFLSKKEQVKFLNDCYEILAENGKLIMNLPALSAFGGLHDKSVGITARFSKAKFNTVVSKTNFKVIEQRYWPFLLSPIIFSVRFFQRLKMLFSKNIDISSDVEMPSKSVNRFLFKLTEFELNFLNWRPWGSSLFLILEK